MMARLSRRKMLSSPPEPRSPRTPTTAFDWDAGTQGRRSAKLLTRILFTTLFIFFLQTNNTQAAGLTEVLSGYYKILSAFSKSSTTKEGIFYALQRLRLEFTPKLTKNLEANFTYDHELMLNDFSNTPDFNFIRQKNQRTLAWFDADKVITDTKHIYERHLLHRAFLKFGSPHSRVTFGKQLIDWGKMRFYSPLDLFNQPLPSDIEADERVGFDALNVELSSNNFSGMNILYGPGRTNAQDSYGLKFNKKLGTYDTTLIAAKHIKEKVLGFGFDGYLWNTGLRGEFTYTRAGKERYPRASLGLDHTFSSETNIILEYFYNGAANNNFSAFSGSILESRERLSSKKNLVSASISRKLTPLFKAQLAAIYDINGKSAFVNPELSYNIKENLDAKAGAQLFAETPGSEFQDSNNLYYCGLKLFF